MRPNAPYMPVATAGLLAILAEGRYDAKAYWVGESDEAILRVDVPLDAAGVGNCDR